MPLESPNENKVPPGPPAADVPGTFADASPNRRAATGTKISLLPEPASAEAAIEEPEPKAPTAGNSEGGRPESTSEAAAETVAAPQGADARPAAPSLAASELQLRGPLSIERSRPEKTASRKKPSSLPPEPDKPAGQASRQVRMVLIPPLPRVNVESKENPFRDAGVELNRPIMMNIVH
jgi:hypothetical protein